MLMVNLLSVADAGTLSFSGADLAASPKATFPSGIPTIVGSSLRFDPTSSAWPILLSLSLASPGELPSLPATIDISMNLTRLTADWDPKIVIGDGTNLVGINLSDNYPGITFATLLDGATNASSFSSTLPGPIGFVDIGSSLTLDMAITLFSDSTTVTGTLLGETRSLSGLVALDGLAPLRLALVGDNELGEQYQLNSVTVSAAWIVPLPPTAMLGAASLALLGFMRRRPIQTRHMSARV